MNILTKTADGSNTLFNEIVGEHYHSAHGALQESKHVFIEAGITHLVKEKQTTEKISILEVGFGTGLNCLLTIAYCDDNKIEVNYVGIEAYPLTTSVIQETGYDQYVPSSIWSSFTDLYQNCFNQSQKLSPTCSLRIMHSTLAETESNGIFDLIYYDAFSVRHQPEMWTDEMIAHACNFLKHNGVFVTYAITGNLKRALKKCGFSIEKLPGAAGKREMLRATKTT
ncbi:MAG: tRNA (5-methylaminomethyl-2-thiouridine)(34)-methyltransferase MnmD [Bacteroidia bacterium]